MAMGLHDLMEPFLGVDEHPFATLVFTRVQGFDQPHASKGKKIHAGDLMGNLRVAWSFELHVPSAKKQQFVTGLRTGAGDTSCDGLGSA